MSTESPARDKDSISNVTTRPDEVLRRGLRVELDQEGGDPSMFLSMLANALEIRAWETLGLPSLARFIETPWPDGLGVSTETVLTLITLHHRFEAKDKDTAERMEWTRRRVRDELNAPLPEHGGNHIRQGDIITLSPSKERGTSQSYLLRRLKRDAPHLAEKVLDGDMSANAAAIEAGFKDKTITVTVTDASRAANSIKRNASPEFVKELIGYLGE